MAKRKTDIDSAPPDELGHFQHHFSITFELEHHPLMMAMAAIALLVFISYLFGHLRKGTTTPTDATAEPKTTNTVTTPEIFLQYPTVQGQPGQPGQPPGPHMGSITLNPFIKGKNSGKGISVWSSPGSKTRVLYVPYGSTHDLVDSGETSGFWHITEGWINNSDVKSHNS